jgi:hypothetical protein
VGIFFALKMINTKKGYRMSTKNFTNTDYSIAANSGNGNITLNGITRTTSDFMLVAYGTNVSSNVGLVAQTSNSTYAGLRFNPTANVWQTSPSVNSDGSAIIAYSNIGNGGGGGGGNSTPGGSNTSVQFNLNGTLGGSANLTWNGSLLNVGGNVNAAYFIGDGSQLSNLPIGNYGNANVASFLPTYNGNLGGTVVSNNQPYINQVGTLASLAVTNGISTGSINVGGNSVITGDLVVNGNVTLPGNINQISGNAGQFFGNSQGVGALYAGISSGYANLPSTVFQVSGDTNQYTQVNFQNINPGNAASSDYVATADNGTNNSFYVDMGIASSTFDGLNGNTLGPVINANDAYLYTIGVNPTEYANLALPAIGGNLIIGTGTPNTHVKIISGGGTDAEVSIDVYGNIVTINGTLNGNGNISADYFIGDGSLLTNLPAGDYSNANVAAYLPTYTGGFGLLTGSITTTANITASHFIGDGSLLTNLPAGDYSNANVAAYLPTFNGNTNATLTSNSQPYITQVGTLASLAVANNASLGRLSVQGNTNIAGNLTVSGNVYIPGNINQISGNAAQFFGDSHGFGALYAGISSGYANLPSTVLQVSANYNEYAEVNFQNINPGNAATTDYVATADNGTNTTYYVDMGIASSSFDGLSANTLGPVINANDAYLYAQGSNGTGIGGNLIVATSTPGTHLKFVVGGGTDSNVVIDVTSAGANVNGNLTANYLFGNGSQLTGLPASYGNANVAAYLPTYTGSLGALTGAITTTGNVTANNVHAANLTATGYFIGDGSLLTNLPAGDYSNANVAAYLPTYSGNIDATIVSNTQPYINQVGTLLSLAVANNASFGARVSVAGNTTIGGDLTVNGNVNIPGNINQISGNSAQFFGNSQGFGALYAGISSGYANLPSTVLQISSNSNEYAQVNFQNINPGNAASSDYVATADNGTNDIYYVDVGIASSTFDGMSGNTLGPVINANDAYLYTMGNVGSAIGGNLIVGTGTANTHLKLVAGGGADNNVIVDITESGANVNGNVNANYFIGNGSQLTGITTSYGNSNVSAYLASGTETNNIVTSANVQSAYGIFTNEVITGSLLANGTITASSFSGSASGLTGLAPSLESGTVQTITNAQVIGALGFTPTPAPSGSSILAGNGSGGFSNVTVGTGLQFVGGVLTANSTGAGTVTSVTGMGSVAGLILSGTVTTSGNLVLGGSLSLTQSQVVTGLGYTPAPQTSGSTLLAGNGSGGFSDVAIGAGLSYTGGTLSATGAGSPSIPSGSVMTFFQAYAPTGWTQNTSFNDFAVRIVSGVGGSTGGSAAFSSVFTTQVPSGTVSIYGVSGSVGYTTLDISTMPSHSHTVSISDPGHTHGVSDPGHSHSYIAVKSGVQLGAGTGGISYSSSTGSSVTNIGIATGYTNISGTGTATGGGGAHTHSFSPSGGSGSFSGNGMNFNVQYLNMILCTKN